MDPLANHQNSIDDIDWLQYFDLDIIDDHLFGDVTLENWDDNSSNQLLELPYTNQVSQDQNDIPLLQYDDQFPYFDPIDEYLNLWEWWEIEGLPLLSNNINNIINDNDDHNNVDQCHVTSTSDAISTIPVVGAATAGRSARKRSRQLELELEEIEKYFEMPIAVAAKELNVGLTVLKKRCRELNIKRWPYRKLKSLKSLIQNVKELGLKEEIEMVEEQKRMMEKVPEMEYTERTKKLRQACFKATYKKRRFNNPPSLSLINFS